MMGYAYSSCNASPVDVVAAGYCLYHLADSDGSLLIHKRRARCDY
jgi:hypothetical protein